MSAKKRGLGRGLNALLTSSIKAEPVQVAETDQTIAAELTADASTIDKELRRLPIEWLKPGKYQPRKDMSAEALEELAASISVQGIIQPIVVRQLEHELFEIIAGERRWRAAQLAGLDKVPCLVKPVADDAAIAIALIENIQREDLNAMEEAVALQRLLTEFELTHQQVADAVGKSRTSVTNILRLNHLNDDVKLLLEHGDIEMGHARALLALDGVLQSEAAATVVTKAYNVRETEKLVKKLTELPAEKPIKEVDPDLQLLTRQLSETLGAKVEISHGSKGRGKMVINYSSLDELDGILAKIDPQWAQSKDLE